MIINGKEFKELDFDELVGKHYGFIYITVNNLTGKKYVGLHTRWDKNYLGSGNYLKNAIKRYGKKHFTRYIIDTAESYDELINLECYYITEAFGVDCAKSKEWYNITSGLQRGGDTWAGMTEEDRRARAKKVSEANKGRKATEEMKEANRKRAIEYFSLESNRKKVSEATKKAMQDPEVRNKISKAKLGKKLSITEERQKRLVELGKQLGKVSHPAWNRGISPSKEVKNKISKTLRRSYNIYLHGELVYENLEAVGGYQGAVDKLNKELGIKIGKNKFSELANSGEECDGYLLHPKLKGLEIKKDSSDKIHLYTVIYRGYMFLDKEPIKGDYGEKGSYIAELVGLPDFRDKVFREILNFDGAYDGKPKVSEAIGLRVEIV